jgi:nucleoside-diphosphate-sugar epimerase
VAARRTAFVTGATGFLGLNLVEHLTRVGWEVVAFHRATSELTYLRRFPVRAAEGALEDPASLLRAMPESVDVVFHTAADVTFWSHHRIRQRRTNVEGTRNAVAAALARKAKKFVHTSTTAVYGFARPPFDEATKHEGRDSWLSYMRTKALAEDEVRHGIAAGLDAVILNPAHVIGRYDRYNWARLIRRAAVGALPRVPPGRGSFCHGVEVARAHVIAAERGRTGENYVLAGADASYRDVVDLIGGLVGRDVERRVVPAGLLRIGGSILGLYSRLTGREPLVTPESAAFLSADLTCRTDKAVRELDYHPAPLPTMLEDSYRWLVAEGFLSAAASSKSPGVS